MGSINLHDKRFQVVANTPNGEVREGTIFHYRQIGKVIWATYNGGDVKMGTLTGLMTETGALKFAYQHINDRNAIMTGLCNSQIEVLDDGRLRLHESWQWTTGDRSSGESVVEEIAR